MKLNTNGALAWVLPEVALARSVSRRRLFLILAATAVFCAALAVVLFTLLGHEEKVARGGAAKFATALVQNDPSAAPQGDEAYVRGVRDHFGAVTSARVIGAHNHAVNTGDNADTRTYFVVEMLLETKRGPAAIALAFDNHSLSSDRFTSVKELEPKDAPHLGEAERARLQTAFDRRGGHAAGDATLSGAAAQTVVVTKRPADDPHLRCAQAAHGDVEKLARC